MYKLRGKRLHYFNPLTIFFLVICFSIFLMFAGQIQYFMIFTLSIVVLVTTTKKKHMKTIVCLTLLLIVAQSLEGLPLESMMANSFLFFLLIMIKLSPVFILVLALMDYSPTELSSSLRAIKVSEKVSIAITVFFRYFPEFRQQIKEIRQGVRIRALPFSVFHPLRSFEQLVVPMMFKGLKISDTVTCSIITKGIEYPVVKTNYRDLKFGLRDIVCMVLTICFAIFIIWKRI